MLETPGPGGFSAPVDVEFGPDGMLYVAGFGSNDIWRYDPIADVFVGQFASSVELQGPPRFAFGPDGNLYVSSFSSDEVLRFDGASGAFIDIFVPAGGALSQPDGIAFGPDGNLYVASVATGEVLEYDASDGSFIGVYAETGSPGLIDMVFGSGGTQTYRDRPPRWAST